MQEQEAGATVHPQGAAEGGQPMQPEQTEPVKKGKGVEYEESSAHAPHYAGGCWLAGLLLALAVAWVGLRLGWRGCGCAWQGETCAEAWSQASSGGAPSAAAGAEAAEAAADDEMEAELGQDLDAPEYRPWQE